MSGAKSRRRGADAEREFCRMASEALGGKFQRNLRQYQESDGDVEIGRFLVEVKHHARIAEREWWRQAVAQADARDCIPALAYKVTRQGWRIIVPLPEAWSSEQQWRGELDYTMTLRPAGFWLIAREDA
jgi:hypothetical protein